MTPWMWVPQRLFSGAFEKLRRATICFVKHVSPPVRLPAWNTSAPTGRIFMKFDIWRFPENLSKKFTFHENLTRITGTLHQDLCLLMIILAETSLDKTCRKNQNTRFIFTVLPCILILLTFFIYQLMHKSFVLKETLKFTLKILQHGSV